jgi:cell wall-associated NlpC family hydrolase
MTDARGRIHAITARLVAAAVLVTSASLAWSTPSSAAPSRKEVAAAQTKLDELNNRLSLLVEQYDQALTRLHQVEADLAEQRTVAANALSQADAAQSLLSNRVKDAFTGGGSKLGLLLGSTSLTQFNDRLNFLSDLVTIDSDVITKASVKRQAARRAVADLALTAKKRQGLVDELAKEKADIQAGIAEQRALVSKMKGQLERAEEAAQAAAKAAAEHQAALAAQQESPASGGGESFGPAPGVSSGAAAAVSAAYSVLGVPYLWGGADPSTGFDCSGLTMWAWAHGGVSLPHSSEMQYAALPHISRADLQPGDLVFFYSPIHHVAMYIGNDRMIHAPHEGSVVSITTFSTYPDFVGAARP